MLSSRVKLSKNRQITGGTVSRLELVVEQTAFLIEKQTEAQQDCNAIFTDLLGAIETKLTEKKDDSESFGYLEKIHDLISSQAQKINDEAQEDIIFLSEQLKALKHIQDIKDPIKSQELLGMILDEDEEIEDTESFKKAIEEEAVLSKQNLITMVDDIKDAVEEGNEQETALYLESILAQESDEDEDEDEDEEDGPLNSACSSCAGCGTGDGCGCGGGEGVDIFEHLSKYEKELFGDKKQEADDKTTH